MEDSTTEATRARVDEKIDSFYEGDLEHATEALSVLWEIVNKDGDIVAPSSATPAVSLFQFCLPPALCKAAYPKLPALAGNEPRPLGLREGRAHQVDSQRPPLRQEVLGETLEDRRHLEAHLLFKHNYGRQGAASEQPYVEIPLWAVFWSAEYL